MGVKSQDAALPTSLQKAKIVKKRNRCKHPPTLSSEMTHHSSVV